MKLTNLKEARDYKVEEWLKNSELKLTVSQKQVLHDSEMIRFSPFKFYERREKEKVSFFWRLSIIFIPFYWIILFLFLPLSFLIRGKWGYGLKFHDNFHAVWMNKLNL